jgi:curved DNA-binding protein CbpA
MKKSYYDLLEVSPEAGIKEITKAYFRLAAKCHPDLVQQLDPDIQELANEKMKNLNLAYQVLKNNDRRAKYDRELKEEQKEAAEKKEEKPVPPAPPPPPPPSEKKKDPYPWAVIKEASLDRLRETLGRSPLNLKPLDLHLPPFTQIFEGKKGLTLFRIFLRLEEKITPAVLTQSLSGLSFSWKSGKNWNPLQKTSMIVCLIGWGFQDLGLIKKRVQEHNRSLLEDIKDQKKNKGAFVVLLDFTTEQFYAPDPGPAVTPLFPVLKDISSLGK